MFDNFTTNSRQKTHTYRMKKLDFDRIGKKIRRRRLGLQITQEALADSLDVNPSHISNIECGRVKPSLTMLVQIAEILQCSVDAFLGEEYAPFRKETGSALTESEQMSARLLELSPEKRVQLLRIMEVL